MQVLNRLIRSWSAGVAALAVASSAVVFAADGADAPGRRVFVVKRCAICHEERAVPLAPPVARLRKDRSLFALGTSLWNHAPMMWANLSEPGIRWPRLSAREVDDLAGYLNGTSPPDLSSNVGRGQVVLIRKGCTRCHTVDGMGQALAGDLVRRGRADSHAEWIAALWNRTPSMLAAHAERRITYPTFEGTDLADLVAFLRATRRGR